MAVSNPRDSKGRFKRKTRRNMEAFVKNGVVHPIRGSEGYSPQRAKGDLTASSIFGHRKSRKKK